MSDLISRQAAIDAFKEYRNIFCDNTPQTFSALPYGDKCRVDEIDNSIATLINLPSAQPEQKKGEWIKCGYWSEGVGMGETYGSCYKCSECGIEVQAGEEKCGMNFCHNCGAKML